jgi:two-component system cell cycle response regulator
MWNRSNQPMAQATPHRGIVGPLSQAAQRVGGVRRWPGWALYLVGGVAVIMAYYLVPAVSLLPAWTPKLVLYQGLSCSAAVAILVGVRRHKPSQRRPWYLLAASQLIYASGGCPEVRGI